jgi:hypothetical protein
VRAAIAVLAVNTLSLIPGWRAAWTTGTAAAHPGARVAVADIGRPVTNPALAIWARWISAVGLGDLDAHPWAAVEDGAEQVTARTFLSGHVEVRAGVLPS